MRERGLEDAVFPGKEPETFVRSVRLPGLAGRYPHEPGPLQPGGRPDSVHPVLCPLRQPGPSRPARSYLSWKGGGNLSGPARGAARPCPMPFGPKATGRSGPMPPLFSPGIGLRSGPLCSGGGDAVRRHRRSVGGWLRLSFLPGHRRHPSGLEGGLQHELPGRCPRPTGGPGLCGAVCLSLSWLPPAGRPLQGRQSGCLCRRPGPDQSTGPDPGHLQQRRPRLHPVGAGQSGLPGAADPAAHLHSPVLSGGTAVGTRRAPYRGAEPPNRPAPARPLLLGGGGGLLRPGGRDHSRQPDGRPGY